MDIYIHHCTCRPIAFQLGFNCSFFNHKHRKCIFHMSMVYNCHSVLLNLSWNWKVVHINLNKCTARQIFQLKNKKDITVTCSTKSTLAESRNRHFTLRNHNYLIKTTVDYLLAYFEVDTAIETISGRHTVLPETWRLWKIGWLFNGTLTQKGNVITAHLMRWSYNNSQKYEFHHRPTTLSPLYTQSNGRSEMPR